MTFMSRLSSESE